MLHLSLLEGNLSVKSLFSSNSNLPNTSLPISNSIFGHIFLAWLWMEILIGISSVCSFVNLLVFLLFSLVFVITLAALFYTRCILIAWVFVIGCKITGGYSNTLLINAKYNVFLFFCDKSKNLKRRGNLLLAKLILLVIWEVKPFLEIIVHNAFPVLANS